MSDRSNVYLFPHVPKCAGSSVGTYLIDQVPAEAVAIIYGRQEQRDWEQPLTRVSQERRDQLRILYGHRLPQKAEEGFAGREIRQVGMLRDPLSFKISMYNFLQKNPVVYGVAGLSFERWYARSKHNSISRFYLKSYFGLSSATMRLMPQSRRFEFLSRQFEKFWFVGDYRNCDEVIEAIAQDIGVAAQKLGNANSAPKDGISAKDLSAAMRQRILDDNALDLALYNAWSKRLWKGEPVLESGTNLAKRWTWQ